MNTWYEVFIDYGEVGTQTLEICLTLQETKDYKKVAQNKIYSLKGTLHIDKWQNSLNPKLVKSIE